MAEFLLGICLMGIGVVLIYWACFAPDEDFDGWGT